ncbi:amino acid adenylation domain-containing protein/thioester reductase domain-containing protein [Nocardiopsis flavescens]|uniref:Amino acid adenylation domain-containing protein/thioester reductase domain-containing protein n=1 Tax=Nocardiopsis flavescens TaxID=758803 RepID=A0A1M6BFE9_9ACTN|nr:AMP-binding protein [Nocardiopsis flavescens]SHI47470.1 amino acid adenylation domain-containing protein/thioester reductase domain-containing protein [Nocardiopsis flavescens]
MTTPHRPALSLPALLDLAARRHPRRPALTDGDRSLDHRGLREAALRTAAALERTGVRPGDRVALAGPRDARLLALLHGALWAGAAAVLVDPRWSGPDLARRLDAVGAGHALTTGEDVEVPGARRVQALDPCAPAPGPVRRSGPAAPAGGTAYLSFTSGSGGEPKPVAVTHANAVHYARSLRRRLGLTRADAPRLGHVTTLAADLGHTSWLLALVTGGSVHVVPDALARDPRAFWPCLARHGTRWLKTTPSHLAVLLEGRPADAPPLETLILGGEALPRSLARDVLERGVARRVVNHYGPTETTVGAVCFTARKAGELPADEAAVPIGTPLGGAALRLVGPDGEEVAGAGEGELLIGGAGVTAGYPGRPEETAARFVRVGGRRMYRTGDVCRRRADGDLVFVGRTDRQVKVRGFRVDPDGVERVAQECPGVARCAVVVRATPDGPRLAAAVRLAPDGDLSALRALLRERLPDYAVPVPLVALPALATTPNGKLDRDAVAAEIDRVLASRAREADGRGPAPGERGRGPRADGTADAIAGLWAAALGVPSVAPDADVIALGGDSILAMRTVSLLRRLGRRARFEDFYRHPTPAGLARACGTADPPAPGGGRDKRGTAPGERAGPPAPAQRWLLGTPLSDPRHWNQSVLLRCGARVVPEALTRAVESVLRRHGALRRPVGPAGPGAPRAADGPGTVGFSPPADPEDLAAVIHGTCTELHRSLDPGAGRLVRVHLFRGGPGTDDRLAVVVHHLVVDGVSWRILLDDLAHAYRRALAGEAGPGPAGDFYRWAAGAARPEPGTAPAVPAVPRGGGDRPRALVWSLPPHATAALAGAGGRRLEARLLAAFAAAVGHRGGADGVRVEVETHGRDTSGAGDAFLDTVGWFTAVRRVRVADGAGPRDVERALESAPEVPLDAPGERPDTGFNFLGAFRPPEEPSLRWSVAPEQPGVARCADGDTLQGLRLTARVVEGRLVADLVYAHPRVADAEAEGIMARFGARVAADAGTAPAPAVRSPSSTSGQPLLPGAPPPPRPHTVREPARVLLTGATGYIGGHLLTELLGRGARVTCLVRAADEAEAARRVGAGTGAVEAVRGDITREGLGMDERAARRAGGVHAVVHAAADVRLVAPPAELENANTAAVRRLVDWMDRHAPGARLHHLSTLAVSGTVAGGPRPFGEADLWIGQEFRTPYERAKFAAEEVLRSWAASGRPCHVHRSGHVAAHSGTGAFQANIADNRVYQLVRGYVLAGAAPRRPGASFAFSYVDTVASAVAALALHPHTAPGVYHVENPHTVAHDDLVRWIAASGRPVALGDDAAFAAALERAEPLHPTEIGLAAAWARLGERNVAVDSSYTVSVLARHGVVFAPPTRRWWAAAMAWGSDAGFLPPAPAPRHSVTR